MNNSVADMKIKVAIKNLTKLSQELPVTSSIVKHNNFTLDSWTNDNPLNHSVNLKSKTKPKNFERLQPNLAIFASRNSSNCSLKSFNNHKIKMHLN